MRIPDQGCIQKNPAREWIADPKQAQQHSRNIKAVLYSRSIPTIVLGLPVWGPSKGPFVQAFPDLYFGVHVEVGLNYCSHYP